MDLRPAEGGPFADGLLPVAILGLGPLAGASDARGRVPVEGVGEVTVWGRLAALVAGGAVSFGRALPAAVDVAAFVVVDATGGLTAGFAEVVPPVLGAREARLEAVVLVIPSAALSLIETRFPPTVDEFVE